MSAWGHKLEPLTGDTLKRSATAPGAGTCSNGIRCPGKREYWKHREHVTYTWTAGAPATHYATYSYLTGRGGRVSWRDLYFCDECAEKWRKKNIKQEAVAP